jgi:hypothetical protein
LAIQVLLPEYPTDLVCKVVTACGGDADAALEKLLADAGRSTSAPTRPAPHHDTAKAAAPSVLDEDEELQLALAASLEASSASTIPASTRLESTFPVASAHVAESVLERTPGSSSSSAAAAPHASSVSQASDQSGATEDIEASGWTVVDAEDNVQKPKINGKCEPKPDAPSWLPLARSGGKDMSSLKATFHDVQTDRLKAALGAPPAAVAVAATSQDMHGAGKGNGRKGGS